MRKFFAVLVVVAVFVVPASAGAVAMDSPAGHSASCGWRTDGYYFWSPTYTETMQYLGHQFFGGHNYRVFQDYHAVCNGCSTPSYYLHNSYVYCG